MRRLTLFAGALFFYATTGFSMGMGSFTALCQAGKDEASQKTIQAMMSIVNEKECDRAARLLSQIKILDLSGQGLSDLRPLGVCQSLRKLNLKSNDITDMSPLKVLPSLQELNLAGNHDVDLSSLGGLRSLKTIVLGQGVPIDLSSNLRDPSKKTSQEDSEAPMDLSVSSILQIAHEVRLAKMRRQGASEKQITKAEEILGRKP